MNLPIPPFIKFTDELDEPAITRLLHTWNETAFPYRKACLHTLFEEQTQRTPEAIALIYQNQQFSYRTLNERANQLAHHLQALGVGPEVLVGVCMHRTLDLITALLGVQKAGGAYVPLDPAYPPERIAFMLEDTRAPVLLTQETLLSTLPVTQAQSLCLDRDWEVIARSAGDNPSNGIDPHHLAYIIYTSGSTGRPKGVAISHANASAMLAWATRIFSREHLDGVLAATSVCFDLSVYEIFLPLSLGGTILLADNALQLPNLPHREAVTLVNTVPSAMAELARTRGLPSSVQIVNLAGEPLRHVLVQKIYQEFPQVQAVYNLYGPSEDTTYSTWACIDRTDMQEPSIGIPLDNTQAYILNADFQPVPVGEIGELYLGGDGVSRGYLNRPGLTAEKYVPDPFSGRAGARLYRTGDLSRYRPDGKIEFLGRMDHQVKIRGIRIELGEIEAVLSRHPNIESQVVMAPTDETGERKLVAYYAVRRLPAPSVRELRQHLQTKLPEYMLPSQFIRLEQMPLNPNGKIDRKALPAPEAVPPERGAMYVSPHNTVETTVARIWEQVLGVEKIGVHDDFFELGGHSLLATQVLTRIREALHVSLPPRALFDAPTVTDLAAVISQAETLHTTISPICPVDRTRGIPLSFAQHEMWFMEQYHPGTPLYNVPAVFELNGELDSALLERTLNEIVARHESLRTIFEEVDYQPIQKVLPPQSIPFQQMDLRALPENDRPQAARQHLLQEAREPLDLQKGPLVKALLLRLDENHHQLLLTIHHILTDGWTTGLILKELADIYLALHAGKPSSLPELSLQYGDVTAWQHTYWPTEIQQQTFWQTQFGGDLTAAVLPADRQAPAAQTYRGARIRHSLLPGLVEALDALGRQTNASLFMVLLAAFKVLLYRHTGQTDIIVSTPAASRSRTEFENLAGLFVNTLPLRNSLEGDPTFQELLERVRHSTLDFLSHQDYPFAKVLECLHLSHNPSYNPLFQYMFAVQNVPVDRVQLPGLDIQFTEELDTGTSKTLLSLFVEFTQEPPFLVAEYNTDLYEEVTIQRLLEQYEVLLQSILQHPHQTISTLSLLPETERHLLLETWNSTAHPYPVDCLHTLITAQAQRTPDQPALQFEGQTLTYRELDARANQIAHALQRQGIGPNQWVAICIDRSLEMVIGLLGILKAGGAYLPLDPDFPQERLAYMLADSGASVLLTTPELRNIFPSYNGAILTPHDETLRHQSVTAPNTMTTPEDLAYVIYTSGSTGKPKGTLIPHRAVVNFMNSMRHQPGVAPSDLLVSVTTISFDIAALEIFLPLLVGGQVILVSREVASDGLQLLAALEESRATVMQATPATWRLLLDAGWEGNPRLKILCGGEALPQNLADALLPRGASLWNLYGPTETTIWSTLSRVQPGCSISIGRPIDNTQCYVLDTAQQLVPIGTPGELYIGGAGLAHGYLNRPELTAEKFVQHPFKPGERLYRTGDLVRYCADGNLEYLGRMDFQVKVRGHRIELGEIETALAQHPAVKSAVVVARQDDSGSQLVAYIIPQSANTPAANDLRTLLRSTLPEYMIPSAFVHLDAFPLTANGKINRLALPAPDLIPPSDEAEFVPPSTPFEEILADIFCDVLKLDTVSIHHNFFDLGGHSLLATQVMSRIYDQFDVKLPVRTLFERPTVAELAMPVEKAVIALIQTMDEATKQELLAI